ncbi:hypothetical protein [Streptomyces erythrochromogenes]|uniref:hypothetical protein n=1 Tax=Streptomyces erythrochromogenes TaxID=285574 RepID=UPI00386EF53A
MTDGAELSSFAGGPYDVRAVVAAMRPETKDGFLLEEVPWQHFPHGDRVREAVHLLHTGNSPVRAGAGVVGGMCADDIRAAAVLAVPFLIRIAADARHPDRGGALAEVSSPARARYFGVASREELLLPRGDNRHYDLSDDYDDYGVEVTGYPAGWSVAAARAAITADTTLLHPCSTTPTPRSASGPHTHWPPPPTSTTRPARPSAPGSPPSPTRSCAPPWSSPPPRPPAPTPTRRPPHGSESAGRTGHRHRRSGWPPRSAGSASPSRAEQVPAPC